MADFSLGKINGKEYFIQDSNADGIYQPSEDKLLVKQGKKTKPTELKAPDGNPTQLTGLTEIPKGTSIKTLQSYCEHLERAANAATVGKAEIMENEIKRAYHAAETSPLADYIDGDYQTFLREQGFGNASFTKRAEAQRYLAKGDLVMFEGALAMANVYAREANIPVVDAKQAQVMKERAFRQLPKLAQRGEVAQVEYGIDMTLRAAAAETEILPREKTRFMEVNRQKALKIGVIKEFKLAHQAAQKGKIPEMNQHLDLALLHATAVKVSPKNEKKMFATLQYNVAVVHHAYVQYNLAKAKFFAEANNEKASGSHLETATTYARKHAVDIEPTQLTNIYTLLSRAHLKRAAQSAKSGNVSLVKFYLASAKPNLAKANNQALLNLQTQILQTAHRQAMKLCLKEAWISAKIGESRKVLDKIDEVKAHAKAAGIPEPKKEIARVEKELNRILDAATGTKV